MYAQTHTSCSCVLCRCKQQLHDCNLAKTRQEETKIITNFVVLSESSDIIFLCESNVQKIIITIFNLLHKYFPYSDFEKTFFYRTAYLLFVSFIFRYHKSCYSKMCLTVSRLPSTTESSSTESSSSQINACFLQFCDEVVKPRMLEQKVISMAFLTRTFVLTARKLGVDDISKNYMHLNVCCKEMHCTQ